MLIYIVLHLHPPIFLPRLNHQSTPTKPTSMFLLSNLITPFCHLITMIILLLSPHHLLSPNLSPNQSNMLNQSRVSMDFFPNTSSNGYLLNLLYALLLITFTKCYHLGLISPYLNRALPLPIFVTNYYRQLLSFMPISLMSTRSFNHLLHCLVPIHLHRQNLYKLLMTIFLLFTQPSQLMVLTLLTKTLFLSLFRHPSHHH